MVIMFSLLFAIPVLSFAQEKQSPDPKASAHEKANEKAKFKHEGDVYNNKAHKKIRAAKRSKKKTAAAKKKAAEVQDKGEGQVKVMF